MNAARETVGFIGLGSQGGPIALRIGAAGYPLVVWARRAEALAPFVGAGASAADSIAALGARCTHVGICVVDDAGVREVCAQLLPAMARGGRVAIHSTIHPETCRALARDAAARGVALIDAPVSGGAPAAAAGKLTVMVGGAADAVAAARPLFATFGELIVHLGNVGAGQLAKLVNNALLAAHMGLAQHALAGGVALGIERTALAELIKASSGRSYGFEVYARLPSPAAFAHGAKMLDKDLGLLGQLLAGNANYLALQKSARDFLDLVP